MRHALLVQAGVVRRVDAQENPGVRMPGGRYLCVVCGHDAFLRTEGVRAAHFAHYVSAPSNCSERTQVPAISIRVTGSQWEVLAGSLTDERPAFLLYLFGEEGQLDVLEPGHPIDLNRRYIYLAPGQRGADNLKLFRLAGNWDGYYAWQFETEPPVPHDLESWLGSLGHPVAALGELSDTRRLIYLIASACNAHPRLGADGIADLSDSTYKLRVRGGASIAADFRHHLQRVADAVCETYCKAREAPQVIPRVVAHVRGDDLTVSCSV